MVSLENLGQAELIPPLANHDQPDGFGENGFPFRITGCDFHQGERILPHGDAFGFVLAGYQHVVPGLDGVGVGFAPPGGACQNSFLVRFLLCAGIWQLENFPIALRTVSRPLSIGILIGMVAGPVAGNSNDGDQVLMTLMCGMQVSWFAISAVTNLYDQFIMPG